MFDKYDEYQEKLLQAQFNISEIIDHKLTRGEIREDFLKELLKSRVPFEVIRKGIVCNDTAQSGQCDILFQAKDSQHRNLGYHALVDIEDCKLVLEVKSDATGGNLKDFNTKAGVIKSLGRNKPLCGIFCYRISLLERTILERFGYKYNPSIDSSVWNEKLNLIYPNIDFVVAIHEEEIQMGDGSIYMDTKKIFIERNLTAARRSDPIFLFTNKPPILKDFFNLLKALK